MSARVAWNLCAGSSIGQCMEMEQLLFAVWLLMIAGGENTLECLASALRGPEWKWAITVM